MTRLQASLLVAALWAAIFLPGLGSIELRGEEGRRILPAVTMMETGNWLVPYVGGKPFLRKPPLVNWAIAASFRLFGPQNEWTARLPSAVALLGLALGMVALSGEAAWMKPPTALIAALLTLTQLAALEKGRLAEIEAIYVSLSGLAIFLWLAWTAEGRSPWLRWTVPFLFLGLALLAKGPLHVLFFYLIAASVLWERRAWRDALHPAHLAGVLLMAAIFLAWFLPYHHQEVTRFAAQKWQEQFAGRVTARFDFGGWITNIPRGLINHLPWLALAPLLWRRDLEQSTGSVWEVFRGTRRAVVGSFFGLLLIPGVLPRYTLPLMAPFAALLAISVSDPRLAPGGGARALRIWWRANQGAALLLLLAACAGPVILAAAARRGTVAWSEAEGALPNLLWPVGALAATASLCLGVWWGRKKLARPEWVACSSGALFAAGSFLYAADAVPFLRRGELLRSTGAAINSAAAPGKELALLDTQYEPMLFYVRHPYAYYLEPNDIPPGDDWVLVRAERQEKLQKARPEFSAAASLPGKLHGIVLLQRRKTARAEDRPGAP